MAIIEGGGSEHDLMQLWAVITELGEQLTQNRSMSVSLYTQAGKIKVRWPQRGARMRPCVLALCKHPRLTIRHVSALGCVAPGD